MNRQECDILNILCDEPKIRQRALAEQSGHSLGVVNRSIKNLITEGYLDKHLSPTEKAREVFSACAPRNAVILAAGFGMRMVPINHEAPKGLLVVKGEPLIERLIRQLHEAGVHRIFVVVGFMKEQYEYLIDEFGVELIVNADYATKNNLYSLSLAEKHLSNTYVVPCDLWCRENPFRARELYSWYLVSRSAEKDSSLRVNRKLELVKVSEEAYGNKMLGIGYLLDADAQQLRRRLQQLSSNSRYDGAFWEEALYRKDRLSVTARVASPQDVVEINTYEQLRELDSGSDALQSDALTAAAESLGTVPEAIKGITVLKKGMTNRSFLFSCKGSQYIMRIPGEGTDQLINRREEAQVYSVIYDKNLCDDIRYLNPENGYKITKFWEGARCCDPENPEDVAACMEKLREFHQLGLKVDHRFDLYGKIKLYESFWEGRPSAYKDYQKTKGHVLSLRPYIEAHKETEVLTHIDAVPDNFLFLQDGEGRQEIRLIDWEYAGMQDPHVDLAMFSVYSFYDREKVDRLIDFYFQGSCPRETRIKIYCYIATCGLLWSNWCEFKRNLGVDFGEYSLFQYRAAKEFYRIAAEEMKKEEG